MCTVLGKLRLCDCQLCNTTPHDYRCFELLVKQSIRERAQLSTRSEELAYYIVHIVGSDEQRPLVNLCWAVSTGIFYNSMAITVSNRTVSIHLSPGLANIGSHVQDDHRNFMDLAVHEL